MINANELMIGNWVSLNGKPIQVCGIKENGYVEFKNKFLADPQDIEPITITPELLTAKIKGSEIRWDKQYLDIGKGKLTVMLPNDYYSKGRIYFNSWAIMESIPEHLHTLQNLMKLLTGKELEVNF